MKNNLKKITHEKLQNEKVCQMEKWISTNTDNFRYMLLSRMEQDCEYFLGYGARHEGRLWALNVKARIHCMKYIHNSFDHDKKPEWLTIKKSTNMRKKC